ncbi:uncharacterized protein LOC120290035 [Eucalyptus grandis]|uniref:uncharacterized protein LOC120290035 n=1 Tax=Eucalyptus grandis TaxID=71139 RepID=UPI00192E91AF|nr:uncharacterized protein LOC120290035 [Eucalyptus grandis]XP_039161648.1 uncharacterized protein LOC120290035 [Eucalyptus grandis]
MASERHSFNAKWTESVTNILIGLLVDEAKKGNRTSSTFNKAGWRNVQSELNRQTGFQFTMVQLRNKVNKLKKQYGSFHKLISQSGFGWDNVNKRIVVDDPSIWESHIKDNVEWARFRKNGFPQYPELCIVFGGTYATRDHAVGCAQEDNLSDDDDNGNDNVCGDNSGGDADGVNAGGDYDGSNANDFFRYQSDNRLFTTDDTGTSARGKHKLDRTPNSKRRRKSNQSSFAETCRAIQYFLKVKSSSPSGDGSASSATSQPPVDPFSVSTMVQILNNMPEIEQDVYNKAVERVCVSREWREAFITGIPARRIGILQFL